MHVRGCDRVRIARCDFRFLLEVLTRDFKSHDFGSAAQQLASAKKVKKEHADLIREYLAALDLIVPSTVEILGAAHGVRRDPSERQ